MKDLRLELRCRNNVLWHAIFDVCPSVAQWCREYQFDQSEIGRYLNLTKSPFRRNEPDELTPIAKRICEVTGYGRDEMWPMSLYQAVTYFRRRVVEVESERFLPLAAAGRLALPPSQQADVEHGELSAVISDVLRTLTPREAQVMRARMGFDGEEETLVQLGKTLGLSRETVRGIEAKALRKLRHVSRSRKLRPYIYGCD